MNPYESPQTDPVHRPFNVKWLWWIFTCVFQGGVGLFHIYFLVDDCGDIVQWFFLFLCGIFFLQGAVNLISAPIYGEAESEN